MYIGDSFNSSLVAVVCVEPEVLKDWAASENIKVIQSLSLNVEDPFPLPVVYDRSKLLTYVWKNYCILQYEDLGQLCADPRAKAAVLAEMDDVGREAQVILTVGDIKVLT